ncbi:hypothetical protein BDP27DRAFT_1312102 [Rhodocollybia butyracea]|uniref:Uncharacterized protein n=1 Tax=Rhodocollybia butyracea TaxID=206335 RepID=A0A9P5QAC0_9AGAR|nr:hypothetical protein BDP27DRAFT_1312102 [Rhodocollybia butyracea]
MCPNFRYYWYAKITSNHIRSYFMIGEKAWRKQGRTSICKSHTRISPSLVYSDLSGLTSLSSMKLPSLEELARRQDEDVRAFEGRQEKLDIVMASRDLKALRNVASRVMQNTAIEVFLIGQGGFNMVNWSFTSSFQNNLHSCTPRYLQSSSKMDRILLRAPMAVMLFKM